MTGSVSAAAMEAVHDFLPCETPVAWLDAALEHVDLLLLDHANCERKAASTAVSLLFRYDAVPGLAGAMSRLAREELRHYEQVLALLAEQGIEVRPLSASRYAGGLRAEVRGTEPERLLDLLLCGALVEARSCERFAALVPRFEGRLARFYGRLLASEARHFQAYLELAGRIAPEAEIASRLDVLREVEAALVTAPDENFRFHSGPPG